MAVIKVAGFQDDQLQTATFVSAVQTNAIASVTITAPASGYTYIPWVLAGYTGAGTGSLTFTPASGIATAGPIGTSYTVTTLGGTAEMLPQSAQFDSGAGTVTISLPAGGVGIVGVLVVAYYYL